MTRTSVFSCLMIVIAAAVGLFASAPAVSQASLPRVLAWEESLRGTEEEELHWPVAVAAASADEVAVADAFTPRVLRFGKSGVSWQLAQTASLPGTPLAMVWDGGRYVVSMRDGKGLVALEGPQLLQRRVGLPAGAVPGPIAARGDGGLLVYDFAGKRVLHLDSEGNLVQETAVVGQVTALLAAPSGGFYAAVGASATVLRFDTDGALSSRWKLPADGPVTAWPVALALEPGGELYVVDRHAGRILLLDDGGRPVGVGARKGWEPGLLQFPNSMTRLPDGLLLVGDEGNGRAQIFRRTDRGAGR